MTTVLMAFDRSARTIDQDGNLHVAVTNISKATVNPYRGQEIPGWQSLGLEPDRVYQMLRAPEELERAAPTFNNLRLMSRHVPVSAADPQEDLVAGTTGTDARFEAPFLVNSLTVWRAEDIALIDSREKCELSCGYYYDPVMEPGTYESLHFDGKMTNIRGNHVALVIEGRAGPDVQVHDSKEFREMPAPLTSRKALIVKGAIAGYLRPKLTAGASLIALDAALAGVNRANWSAKKPAVVAAVLAMKPKLAADASLDGVHEFIDRLDNEEDGAAKDDDLNAEDEDETDEEKAARMKKEADDKAKDEKEDDMPERAKDGYGSMDQKAMDAAIADARKSIRAELRDATEARELVRPLVGSVAVALDSAEAIYRYALDAAKVDVTDVHPSAFRAMVGMLNAKGGPKPRIAQDSAAPSLSAMFPDVARIKQS